MRISCGRSFGISCFVGGWKTWRWFVSTPISTYTVALNIAPGVRDAARRLLPDGPDYVGFAPGSGGPPKCWPLERFIEVAKNQAAQGRVPVFLLGPKEVDWLGEIRAGVPGALFPLQEPWAAEAFVFSPYLTMALAARIGAALSNDSGAGHMLCVGGAPVIILYGVTRPDKFMPMTDRLTIVRAQDFGGAEMHHIPVDAATAALEAALADGPGRLGD